MATIRSPSPGPAARGRLSRDIVRVGLDRTAFGDLYHQMLEISWRRLLIAVVVFYLVANVFFALCYMATGGGIENARPGNFTDLFFFSVQTMATIGYGKLVPVSVVANIFVTIESLIGLLGFAVMTGLIFAKFARPTAAVIFSESIVFSSFDGQPSLILRVANKRVSQIVEATLRLVMLRTMQTSEGNQIRRLIDLELVRSQNAFFALTWMAIHPINSRSPFYGMTEAEVLASDMNIVASLTGIEELSSQTVHARYWYGSSDFKFNARFVDIIGPGPDGNAMIDYAKFQLTEPSRNPLGNPLGAQGEGLSAGAETLSAAAANA